ncbi:hypothetical protein [Reyranella sp.]|jgi:hypothetical protein
MPSFLAGLRRLQADTRRDSLLQYSALVLLVAVALVALASQFGNPLAL